MMTFLHSTEQFMEPRREKGGGEEQNWKRAEGQVWLYAWHRWEKQQSHWETSGDENWQQQQRAQTSTAST